MLRNSWSDGFQQNPYVLSACIYLEVIVFGRSEDFGKELVLLIEVIAPSAVVDCDCDKIRMV